MKGNKILIVEDEKLTVELLKLHLYDEGFDIIVAYDGEEGLKKACRERPNLIILDLMLPKVDGLEVCRRLKNDIKTRNIPVVMLTCRTDMEVKLEGFEKGADDYIVKPFDQRELLARVNSILRLISLQQSLQRSREEVERISVINEINKAISSSLNLEELLKIIGMQTGKLIDYDLISIAFIDKNKKFVRVRTMVPRNEILLKPEFYITIESSIIKDMRCGSTGYITGLSGKKIPELMTEPGGNELLSAIIIPLISRGEIIGIFNIASSKKDAFSHTELEVAEQIGPQVVIAMENSRLYEKVSESEKNYSQLFDNALEVILLKEPDTGNIVGANRKACEVLSFSKKELLSMTLSDIISPESEPDSRNILSIIKARGEFIFETCYRKKDGSFLNVEVSAKLIDFHGKKLVQSFARDITIRKQAEKELTFLANITTNSPLAIVGTDNNGIITSWNKGGEIIFGYSAEEIIGKPYRVLVPDELESTKKRLLQEALVKGLLEEIETERISKGGKRIPVKITYSVIKDDDGISLGVAYIIRNIEQERELHRQLIQSEKLSTMGQLVSGVAHELNNPLTGVIGFSELLMMESFDGIKDDLKKIHKEATRAKRIVQNLLSFARMHKPEKTKVDLNAIINNVLELKSYEMKVDNIEISYSPAPDLPVTMGDPHQLQQVFLNIINNAHQAMVSSGNSGNLAIKTFSQESTLFVEFIDTGPGIPNENITKIFDPFFTTKEVGKGTGLGLSLSYGIIRDHGGYIQVCSQVRKGTTFTVELPLVIDPAVVSQVKQIPSTYYPSVRGYDILIVDDEDTVLELLNGILTREGNRVEMAGNGSIALEKIADKEYFDIIICDVKMPNMNGSELYNLLKEEGSVLTENFIFMSGAITADVGELEFFDHDIHPFLEKPFSVGDVLKAVFKIVSDKKRESLSYKDYEKVKIMTSL